MGTVQVAVSIEERVLRALDRQVAKGVFPSRSRAVQAAVELLLEREKVAGSLLGALSKLDPAEEKQLADEVFAAEHLGS